MDRNFFLFREAYVWEVHQTNTKKIFYFMLPGSVSRYYNLFISNDKKWALLSEYGRTATAEVNFYQ